MIKRLPWDSACFGYEVGVIPVGDDLNLQQFMEDSDAYQLVYVFSKQDLGSLPVRMKKVDEKITLETGLQSVKGTIQKDQIPVGRVVALSYLNNNLSDIRFKSIKQEFIDLALISGEYSRFRIDERLGNGEFEKLYSSWAEKSLEGNDEGFIFFRENRLCGMITLSSQAKNKFKVGLLAVSRDCREQGVGSLLINLACERTREEVSQVVQVTTQKANQKAVSFYQKRGFTVVDEQDVYHWWRG